MDICYFYKGGRQLLRCDGGQNSRKHFTITFRDVVTSADAIEFEKGKTYYLIGKFFICSFVFFTNNRMKLELEIFRCSRPQYSLSRFTYRQLS